jgi:hypothetical protein
MSDTNPQTWKQHVDTVLTPDEQAQIKKDLDEKNKDRPLTPLEKFLRLVITVTGELL